MNQFLVKLRALTESGLWRIEEHHCSMIDSILCIDNSTLVSPGIGVVNPDTLTQFTGLYDIDGAELYHSDIIRLESGLLVAIGFEKGGFGFHVLHQFVHFTEHWRFKEGSFTQLIYKKVGNIFENPELKAKLKLF